MMIENPSVWPNVAAAASPDLVADLHLGPMPFEYVPGDVSQGFAMPTTLDQATADLVWQFIEHVASSEMLSIYVDLVQTPVARAEANEGLMATPDTAQIADANAKAVMIIPNSYFGVRTRYADFSAEVTNALRSVLQGDDVSSALAALEQRLTAAGINPLE